MKHLKKYSIIQYVALKDQPRIANPNKTVMLLSNTWESQDYNHVKLFRPMAQIFCYTGTIMELFVDSDPDLLDQSYRIEIIYDLGTREKK